MPRHVSPLGAKGAGKYLPALLTSALALCAYTNSTYAQCSYMGGYPWKDGGCLIAKDLNAAIAGRNPLLDYPERPGQSVLGFMAGVPIFGAPPAATVPFPTPTTLGGVKSFTAPSGQFLTGVTDTGDYTTGAPPGGNAAALPVVATNAALKTLPGTLGQRVKRASFAAPNDGGAGEYQWSASNCA